MKTKVTQLLKDNDVRGMAQYIQNGGRLDYLISVQLGEERVGLNPLVYSMVKGRPDYSMANLLLACMDPLEIKDFLASFPYPLERIGFFGAGATNESMLDALYNTAPEEEQHAISSRLELLFRNPSRFEENSRFQMKYLKPVHQLRLAIAWDDTKRLLEILDDNSTLLQDHPKDNFLMYCIEEQAVFCFDVLKNHMKREKKAAIWNEKHSGAVLGSLLQNHDDLDLYSQS